MEALGGDRGSGESHFTDRASRKARASHSERAPVPRLDPAHTHGRQGWWLALPAASTIASSLFFGRKVPPTLWLHSPFCVVCVSLFGSCSHPPPRPSLLRLPVPGRRTRHMLQVVLPGKHWLWWGFLLELGRCAGNLPSPALSGAAQGAGRPRHHAECKPWGPEAPGPAAWRWPGRGRWGGGTQGVLRTAAPWSSASGVPAQWAPGCRGASGPPSVDGRVTRPLGGAELVGNTGEGCSSRPQPRRSRQVCRGWASLGRVAQPWVGEDGSEGEPAHPRALAARTAAGANRQPGEEGTAGLECVHLSLCLCPIAGLLVSQHAGLPRGRFLAGPTGLGTPQVSSVFRAGQVCRGAGVWAPIWQRTQRREQSPSPAPGPSPPADSAPARALTLCRSQGAAPAPCPLFSEPVPWVGAGGLSPC